MYWMLISLSLCFLWFRLIADLRLEWMTDPQYSYGLIVPMLCLGLMLRRRTAFNEMGGQPPDARAAGLGTYCLIAFFASLYLPIRLIEAATPEWRFIQWALGIVTIALTLGVIRVGAGPGWLRQLTFPIFFFLVAIPWPTLIETPVIQGLTRVSATVVMELLYLCGIPALIHGNLIEVSTGILGIEEACSGIRSFQTSLMTCLFFGEFYRLRPAWRWLLIPIGLGLALAFNIGRMFFLTAIAAKKGVEAISRYHDPAGVSSAIFCTLALWLLAHVLSRRQNRALIFSPATPPLTDATAAKVGFRATGFRRLAVCLLVWLIIVEAGVQSWYRYREANLKPTPAWTMNFPTDNPSVKILPIDEATRNLLRYDEGRQATWTDDDGTFWQAFYFNWLPGRVAGYLAKRHTPEICLPAMGLKLVAGPQLNIVNFHGVDLPIRSYVFADENNSIQVFHCRWEAGADREAYVQNESARYNLVRAVWAGRGVSGQKVFEVIISGINNRQQAWQELTNQLDRLIVVQTANNAP
jgi:exosortase